MYIIEQLLRWIFPKKLDEEYDYNPLNHDNLEENADECNHEFMPVDSTGETLACIKCGFIVQIKEDKLIEDE